MIPRLTEVSEGLKIPRSLVDGLKMLWTPNEEVCGLIFVDASFAVVRNVAEDPTHNFEMHRGDVQDLYEKHGDDIIGIFHTHSNSVFYPSREDIAGWPRAAVRYWIVTQNSVSEWRKSGDRAYVVCTNP